MDWALNAIGGGGQRVLERLLVTLGCEIKGTELYEECGPCCCGGYKGEEFRGIMLADDTIAEFGL